MPRRPVPASSAGRRANGLAPTLVTLALVLSGCSVPPRTLDETTNPSLPSGYNWKKEIANWMKRAFVEPASLRSVTIADPVPIDAQFFTGWLVCVEVDARTRNGGYMGPRRFALGFATSASKDGTGKTVTSATLVTPDDSRRLSPVECDRRPLAWTPWPEWERSLEPPSPKRRSRPG